MRNTYSLENNNDSINPDLRNSRYGTDVFGAYNSAQTEQMVADTTARLLRLLAIQDKNYLEVDKRMSEKKEYIFWPKSENWPANDSPEYSKLDKMPQIANFFTFVPLVTKSKKIFYIRTGGPEVMSFVFKDKTVQVDSLERENIYSLYAYADPEHNIVRIISKTYPLMYKLSEDNTLADGILPTRSETREFGGLNFFASRMIEKIVDSAIEKINDNSTSDALKRDVVELLSTFLDACINQANISDVAEGIATGITERLRIDFELARSKAFCKYEFKRNDGSRYSEFIDSEARRVLEIRPLKDADFNNFKTSLIESVKNEIDQRNFVLSKVYKDLLDYDERKKAKERLESLRNKVQEMQDATSEDLNSVNSDPAVKALESSIVSLRARLAQKNSEIEKLKTQQDAEQANIAMALQIRNNPGDESETTGLVAKVAAASLIAGSVFWFVSRRK